MLYQIKEPWNQYPASTTDTNRLEFKLSYTVKLGRYILIENFYNAKCQQSVIRCHVCIFSKRAVV